MAPRHKSNRSWINRHLHDPYVLRARQEGWRSRAIYKLVEIDQKDHLLRPGQIVVDLGAAPGSWSQWAAQRLNLGNNKGRVLALDILDMPPISNVELVRGDFRDQETLNRLDALLHGQSVDVVLSDMLPNVSGVAMVDQSRSYALAELALEFARDHLHEEGAFLVKLLQGCDFKSFLASMRQSFQHVLSRKPKASRDSSTEIYLLGKNLR